MTLWQRVLVEKRLVIVPLALGILGNIAAYALVVRPLGIKSAGAASRAAAAATAVKEAERDHAAAGALVTGKARADEAISTFYGKVLPADQAAAVRLTYVPLPTIARKANIKVIGRRWETEPLKKDARLGQ